MASQIQFPINRPVESNFLRAQRKRLWAGTTSKVKLSHVVDLIFNWSPNFKSSICCGSCRKLYILCRQVVNISATLETISTTNWAVMPSRFIYFFRWTGVKFRPFSDRCKLQTVTWKLIVRKRYETQRVLKFTRVSENRISSNKRPLPNKRKHPRP